MTKEDFIEAVESANINQDWWLQEILSQLEDKYALGYIERRMDELNGIMASSDEEYREEILEMAGWDIWGR